MLRIVLTLLAVLVLAVAGCGGDDDENGGGGSAATSTPTATEESGGGGGGDGGGESIQLGAPADGGLVFEPDTLTAQAGSVTIDFENPSSVPHAVAIDGVDGESDEVTDANTSLTVDLEPGEYEFYCPVGNHQDAGMTGTLTVN